jgi:hypothetical protein
MATELVAGAATALAVYTLARQRNAAPVAQECSRAMVEVETEAAPVGFRQTLAYFQQILRWV